MDCISSYHILFQTCSTCCNPSSGYIKNNKDVPINLLPAKSTKFLVKPTCNIRIIFKSCFKSYGQFG